MYLRARKQFRDYPLLKKITASLVVLVIIPMLLLVAVLTVWLYRTNTAALLEKNHERLQDGLTAVEETLKNAESLPMDCLINTAFLRFCEGREFGRDYVRVREWLNELFAAAPAYENICISLLSGKVFEAGKYVNESADTALDKLEGRESMWELSHNTDYGYPGISKEQKNLLVFYSLIKEYVPSREETVYGTVSARLREEDICRLYEQMFSGQYRSIFLLNGEGIIASSTDKTVLEEKWEPFSRFCQAAKEKQGMYFHGGMLYLYVKSDSAAYYLLEEIPLFSFYGGVAAIILAGLGVMILCILFGVVFGRVQRHYIVDPVYALQSAFGQMEKGDFPVIPYNGRRDEIGGLQKAFNRMSERLNNLINRVYRADYAKKEAELRALTEQIKPHFLYNTLDSIHWKAIRNRDGEVAEQIMALSDVYRYLLNKGDEFILVKDELDFLNRYLFLMNMRFGGRVAWETRVDEGTETVRIPKLIIQPLIENALVHGLEPSQEGGKITLTIRTEENMLKILVEDTGVGFGRDVDLEKDAVEGLEGSFALKNINNRLKIHYPERYLYRVQSALAGGSRVVVWIPLEEESL